MLSLGSYLFSADFLVDVVENWQSEFLAIASMAILSVYLRQRGSPESKPVGASHSVSDRSGSSSRMVVMTTRRAHAA